MEYIIGICDDEILQLKVNSVYIKEIAARNQIPVLIKGFRNPSQLFLFLQKQNLDILFLDIDLGEESGIDVAKRLMLEYPELTIIFLTGHREFTNEAFDVEALGYIVKPIDEHKLERTLNKAFTQILGVKSKVADSSLIITEENIKKKINPADILYIERVLSKSLIHTKKRIYQVYEPITSLCERLDNHFLRINQSEVVNRSEIIKIEKNTVYLRDKRELKIGRTYKKAVMEEYFN